MKRFIITRLLITIAVTVGVAILIFTILYFTPGDVVGSILGPGATHEQKVAMEETLGLNESYFARLGSFLYQTFFKFDLGKSWVTMADIGQEIGRRLPRTALIALISVVASAVFGIPLGVLAATHQDGLADKVVLAGSSFMRCVPNFWLALMFVLLFSLKLDWFPQYYAEDPGLRAYIIPCITIMVGSFAWTARQMRSSMLEVIRADYVTAAQAQGFSKIGVHYLHALPNAVIPIITTLGTQFGISLGGTIVLETIFSIPGMGDYIQQGINRRDLPIVQGSIVVIAILFSLVMLLVDICYAIVDPRIRTQYEAGGKGRRRKKV